VTRCGAPRCAPSFVAGPDERDPGDSTGNPNNPDPGKRVTWGDQTWEEMMIGLGDNVDKVEDTKE
jgi:hypothetical protein